MAKSFFLQRNSFEKRAISVLLCGFIIINANDLRFHQVFDHKYIFYLLLSVLVLIITSCSYDRKLAKQFVESNPDISILVMPTDDIFKVNMKRDELGDDTTTMDEWQIDSALMANSLFLKDISDSIFLEAYYNSFFDELEKLNVKTYTEDYIDSFLFIRSSAFLLNIAQIEADEYVKNFKDSEEFNDFVYTKTLPLNAVSINTWFEITRLNNNKGSRRVFFAEDEISDNAYGYFSENLFTGQVSYKYFLREMEIEDIYHKCEELGQKYAGYVFDYIMNSYISRNFPPDRKRKYYMHYKRSINSFEPAYDNRFILME